MSKPVTKAAPKVTKPVKPAAPKPVKTAAPKPVNNGNSAASSRTLNPKDTFTPSNENDSGEIRSLPNLSELNPASDTPATPDKHFSYESRNYKDLTEAQAYSPATPASQAKMTGTDANDQINQDYHQINQDMQRYLAGDPNGPKLPDTTDWTSFGKYASREAGEQIRNTEDVIQAMHGDAEAATDLMRNGITKTNVTQGALVGTDIVGRALNNQSGDFAKGAKETLSGNPAGPVTAGKAVADTSADVGQMGADVLGPECQELLVRQARATVQPDDQDVGDPGHGRCGRGVRLRWRRLVVPLLDGADQPLRASELVVDEVLGLRILHHLLDEGLVDVEPLHPAVVVGDDELLLVLDHEHVGGDGDGPLVDLREVPRGHALELLDLLDRVDHLFHLDVERLDDGVEVAALDVLEVVGDDGLLDLVEAEHLGSLAEERRGVRKVGPPCLQDGAHGLVVEAPGELQARDVGRVHVDRGRCTVSGQEEPLSALRGLRERFFLS